MRATCFVLLLVVGCVQRNVETRCVDAETDEVVFDGPTVLVDSTPHRTSIRRADGTWIVFTGRRIQCVIESVPTGAE